MYLRFMIRTFVIQCLWGLAVFFVCFISNLAFSQGNKSPNPHSIVISAHAMVEILSYDDSLHAFAISSLKVAGQGPLYATPESLAKAIPALSLDRLRRSPNSVLTQEFMTDEKLVIFAPSIGETPKSTASKLNNKSGLDNKPIRNPASIDGN